MSSAPFFARVLFAPLVLALALMAGCAQAGKTASKVAVKPPPSAPADSPRTRDNSDKTAGYDARPEVRAFAAEVAARRQWDADWVLRQLSQAQLRTASQRLMMPAPPGQPKNWAAYRARFVEPQRIQAGAEFWKTHADALQRAETRFGVPAEIIIGILGVETYYGRITGNFRVLDALTTLAFDFPGGRSDRSAYFREELEEFLAFTRREDMAPIVVQGSFAGAIGLPQFMPGSINRFAVDFDGDGHIDLSGSAADAIGSIANFLVQHGWTAGMPTDFAVSPPPEGEARQRLLAPDILPSFTAEQMASAGARLSDAGRAHGGALALVLVENGSAAPSFIAGTQNFYALTRYNRSSYYARAVIDLGAAVRAAL